MVAVGSGATNIDSESRGTLAPVSIEQPHFLVLIQGDKDMSRMSSAGLNTANFTGDHAVAAVSDQSHSNTH